MPGPSTKPDKPASSFPDKPLDPAIYPLPTRLLHSLYILLVLPMFVLGYCLSESIEPGHKLLFWHVLIGLVLLILAVPRLFFTGLLPGPKMLLKDVYQKIARAVHILLYILMLLVPSSGYFLLTESGISLQTVFFSEAARQDIPQSLLATLHAVFAWFMAALIVLHILAFLKHNLLRRDGGWRKMFGFSPGNSSKDLN